MPVHHAAWLGGLVPGPLPSERRATCGACAMLPPAGAAASSNDLFFTPETKCCTYQPDLANFLVGRVLADPDPTAAEGQATVRARIAARVGVSPLGLRQAPVYGLLYQKSPGAFGRATSMRCPHLLTGGRCGVWRHREATCSTWFCKHERGEVSRVFWRRVHELLRAAESAVALHCLRELDLGAEALAALFPPDGRNPFLREGFGPAELDGRIEDATYAALWGAWRGRELELYDRCADLAPRIWSEVVRLGGVELETLGRLVVDAYAALRSTVLPPRLGQRRLRVVYGPSNQVQVTSYNGFDPLTLPRRLVEALHCFDGRPTVEALRAVEAEHGLRVSEGALRKLVDFGVLVPP
jgi:hypothetical protein